MSKMKFLSAMALLAALGGCAATVPLQKEQVAQLKRETSTQDLDKILGKATLTASYAFEANSKKYLAKQYSLVTGSKTEMLVVCTPRCMPVWEPVNVTADYVIVQDAASQQLYAWGTFDDLGKSSDADVQSIMPALTKQRELAALANKK